MTAPPSSAPIPFSVSGKTAIVTGAGSGINLSFARLLLSRNCNVVFADLALRPEAQALVAAHNDASRSPRALFVRTDVTSWPALRAMFAATLQAFGDFDILCPGAGVYEPHWSNFWHPPGSSPEARDDPDGGRYKLLDINLTHPVRATQLALACWLHPRAPADGTRPAPRRAGSANPKRVVHISSVAGQAPNFNAPLYGASKFAITGFVRCLAPLEARAGVRVNAVAPGVIKTPLWTEHPEKLVVVDEGRDGWATPEEVAEAMLRCCEDEALVGGTVLEVGKGNTRVVDVYNDPGPDTDPRRGLTASNVGQLAETIWGWLGDEKVWGDGLGSKL
ncbi:short-chain dehydrogenase [Macrophomina phaseolina]|uniref:Short-chain dehydrogenase n=1 Tax=Macrophomina phaseolina TaxID=35725 RepID=A0ABQ8GPW3_9PEZI|nr:short-chain dehydrogenase [Macrophomina phaseolina]